MVTGRALPRSLRGRAVASRWQMVRRPPYCEGTGNIMRKVITALCVLASVELTSDAVAQQWSEYRPADARFRVEMPGTPEIRSDTIPELGSLKLTQAVVESCRWLVRRQLCRFTARPDQECKRQQHSRHRSGHNHQMAREPQ